MPLGMYAQSKHALRLAGQVASVDADCVIKADCLVADIKHADCLISRARWRASTPTTTLFSCSATPTSSATASALTISVHALALPQRVMVALRQRPELIDATSHARLYSYTTRACVFTPQRARAHTGRILTADARVNAFVFFIAGGKEAIRLAQVRTPAAACGGAASQRRTCGPPFTPRGPAPRPAHPHRPAQLCLEFVRASNEEDLACLAWVRLSWFGSPARRASGSRLRWLPCTAGAQLALQPAPLVSRTV